MTNQFTHLTPASTKRVYKIKALCGSVLNARSLSHVEATPEAAAQLAQYSFMKPLCPKCAAALLIAETSSVGA